MPVPDPRTQRQRKRIVYGGEIPDLVNPPSGCRFSTRCPLATAQCRETAPKLSERTPGHLVACWNR